MLSAQCPATGHLDADLASAPMPPREDEDTPGPVHHHLGQHGLQGHVDRGRIQRLDQSHRPQMVQPCSEGHVEPPGRAGPHAPPFLHQIPLLRFHLRDGGQAASLERQQQRRVRLQRHTPGAQLGQARPDLLEPLPPCSRIKGLRRTGADDGLDAALSG